VDPQFNAMVANALAPDGHRLLIVGSGADAVSTYEREKPDLVLFDLELPGIDGLETCRSLVAAHGESCAPIVFFSSNATPTEIAAGFGSGATDYLTKTASGDEIRARVHNYLANHVLMRQQQALADQLSQANAAKNRFIGMAAHDMRNPLASIRGFAEFLMDGTFGTMPPVQLALVSIIHGTSNIMLKTVNELLDVATIEAGQLKLQPSQHNLADVVAKSVAQAKLEARKKRARIEAPESGIAVVLTIDAEKMKQVIDNLLSNAIKFSPAASTITIAVAAAENGTCGFTVRDEGPGLPNSIRTWLNSGGASLAGMGGTEEKPGVGLIITRNIVRAHRGSISAENLPGKGCEVRVRLPAD
jgi:signal transduction histidine kinase